MTVNNIKIYDPAGHNTVPTWRWQVEANTTVLRGEPVKLKSAGSPYVIVLADADPVIGTTTDMIGIAASTSTATAAVDGYVDVYLPLQGLIYEAAGKTASTVDAQGEIDLLVGDRVVFDLTSSVFTVDAAAGNGATNGIMIVGGRPGVVYFTIDSDATAL